MLKSLLVIAAGPSLRKGATDASAVGGLSGFVRVRASSFEEAKEFLNGNPVFEAGGTVEIRELPWQ